MASQLQQVLRSLCFNTGWKYAVFWKLQHRARIMFTWEDAYYDNSQYLDRKCLSETAGSSNDGPYSHDPLGLAVAKMSYQVYCLGEGIVGQVAVSGKHSWIFSDQHVSDSSTSEYFGGWQNQFSSGIKTIAVVAVIPHGVVQLGSLHKLPEDLRLVNHIRVVFSELQDALASSCLSETHMRNPDAADCLVKLRKSFHDDEANLCSHLFSQSGRSGNHFDFSPPPLGFPMEKTLKIKLPERVDCSTPGDEISLPSTSKNNLVTRLQQGLQSVDDTKYRAEMNNFKDSGKRPENLSMPSVNHTTVQTEDQQMVASELPVEIFNSQAFMDQGEFHIPELPSMQRYNDLKNPEQPIRSTHVETHISPFSFCAGYELYEALGHSFEKGNSCVWEAEKTGSDMAVDISVSNLVMENSDIHLLDAVIAKVSHKGADTESEKSCHNTGVSLLTAERSPCASICSISSAGYSFDRDTSSSLNSVTCGVESLKGFSSASSSKGSEHLERPHIAVKTSKKRARPGESFRPRPRDRQLIQDRIKELRELVPNGSKCSIDSLLERTIKHMLFLQNVTKHAEKLQKCSASKLLDKDTGIRRFSSREQGSSWAVEVGNSQKVCPIIVENINMNGQMLVEMLCEECNQFLDIAETIRSLGLTILKGVSDPYGNKTWMCFVVENNRSMHRMDVLWSLMQLLQPKIITQSPE